MNPPPTLLARLRARNPLPSGTTTVGVGLVVNGAMAFVFLGLTARVLGAEAFAPLGVLWASIYIVGPGFFLPLEQEVARGLANRWARGIGTGTLVRQAGTIGAALVVVLLLVTAAASVWLLTHLFSDEVLILVGFALALPAYALAHLIREQSDGPEYPPVLDLVAPVIGFVGLLFAGAHTGDPDPLSIARTVTGALFLGVITDAMLLGHWYLVQPGLPRDPIRELVKWTAAIWPLELLFLLWPVGMVSAINGTIDDGWDGLLSWFWVACTITTIALIGVTWAALKEKEYSAVMAATGLLYLAILTAFGMDLVARAILA